MGEHKKYNVYYIITLSYDHGSHTYLLTCTKQLYKRAVGRDLSVSNNEVNACQPSGYCLSMQSYLFAGIILGSVNSIGSATVI